MTDRPSADRTELARRDLRSDEYAPLWLAVRRRLERNGIQLTGTPVAVKTPDDTTRRAVAGLLGVSAAGDGPLRIRLHDLDDLLRQGAAEVGLVDWIEQLGGPLRDRPTERRTTDAARRNAWATVYDHPTLGQRPELGDWVAALRRSGAATRRAGSPVAGAELVEAALDVVAALPAGNRALAVFAAEVTDDPHSLDRGTPLGDLVSDALTRLEHAGDDADDGDDDRPAAAAYWWRRRWARVGVICDDLSVSTLALNLPVRSDGDIVANSIDEHRICGVPLRLTLQQIATATLLVDPKPVFVTENPSVVAMATNRLEDSSSPLVCVEGYPNSAALALLDLLASAGCNLHYHGDFDWDGLRIGASIIGRYSASSWRFSAVDYRQAATHGGVELGTAAGTPETPWSPELPTAMVDHGVAVFEEQVLDHLLDDLRA